jgi:hypothetical protein
LKELLYNNNIIIGNHFAEHINAASLKKNEYNDLFFSNHDLIESYLKFKCNSLAFPYGLSRDIPFFYKFSKFSYNYYSNFPGNNCVEKNDMIRLRYNLNENNIINILDV